MDTKNDLNTQTEEQTQTKNNDKEFNFSELRKKVELKERIIENQGNEIQNLKSQLQEFISSQQQNQKDSRDEDIPTLGEVKSTFRKEIERIREETKKETLALLEEQKKAAFLKSNADFSQVLTAEVIQKFAENHPEIAEQMAEMPDGFARQKLLYQTIKFLDLQKKKEESAKPSIQETVNKNMRSPMYRPTEMSNAPYSPAADFSPAGMKAAYEKMKQNQQRARF